MIRILSVIHLARVTRKALLTASETSNALAIGPKKPPWLLAAAVVCAACVACSAVCCTAAVASARVASRAANLSRLCCELDKPSHSQLQTSRMASAASADVKCTQISFLVQAFCACIWDTRLHPGECLNPGQALASDPNGGMTVSSETSMWQPWP